MKRLRRVRDLITGRMDGALGEALIGPTARLRASPLKRELKVLSPQDFRLAVTPTIASGTRYHRFSQVVDRLTSEIEKLRPKIAKTS